jgi:hypothetical protein
MTEPQRVDWYAYPVVPLRLRLIGVHFHDDETASDADCAAFAQHPDLYERMLLARPSANSISVALEITTGEGAPLYMQVTYAADFRLHDDLAKEERDKALKYTAYYLAPRTIYPYLREFIANLTKRWRGGEITLPYFPLPTQRVDESELEIPQPLEEYQAELPLTGEGQDERAGTNV